MDVMHGLNELKRKGGRQRLEVIEVVITGERSREDERGWKEQRKVSFTLQIP